MDLLDVIYLWLFETLCWLKDLNWWSVSYLKWSKNIGCCMLAYAILPVLVWVLVWPPHSNSWIVRFDCFVKFETFILLRTITFHTHTNCWYTSPYSHPPNMNEHATLTCYPAWSTCIFGYLYFQYLYQMTSVSPYFRIILTLQVLTVVIFHNLVVYGD